MLIVLLVSIGVLFSSASAAVRRAPPAPRRCGLFVTLVLGASVLHHARIAAAQADRKPENGAGILAVITLPMIFLSNIWFPIDGAPTWVQDIAKAFPLRPLADGMQARFDPRYGGTTIMWSRPGPLIVPASDRAAGLMVVYLRSLSRRA